MNAAQRWKWNNVFFYRVFVSFDLLFGFVRRIAFSRCSQSICGTRIHGSKLQKTFVLHLPLIEAGILFIIFEFEVHSLIQWGIIVWFGVFSLSKPIVCALTQGFLWISNNSILPIDFRMDFFSFQETDIKQKQCLLEII